MCQHYAISDETGASEDLGILRGPGVNALETLRDHTLGCCIFFQRKNFKNVFEKLREHFYFLIRSPNTHNSHIEWARTKARNWEINPGVPCQYQESTIPSACQGLQQQEVRSGGGNQTQACQYTLQACNTKLSPYSIVSRLIPWYGPCLSSSAD